MSMVSIVQLAALVSACNGLSVPPVDESRKFGQTGSQIVKISSGAAADGVENWWGAEAAEAEAKAVKARLAAETASEEAGSISERQLEAMDRHANSEVRKEEGKEEKLANVVDSMRREGAAADRVVETMVRQQRVQEAEEERKFAEMERKIRHIERAGVYTENEYEQAKATEKEERRSAINERSEERRQANEERKAARELHEAQKEVQKAKNKERAYLQRRGELERLTSWRLWNEATSLRDAAEANGSLSQEEILRTLDVTKEAFSNMTLTIAKIYDPPNASAWFQERIASIRFKSMAASAHLLEAIKHKTAEFANTSKDYEGQQFVGLLSRYLESAKSEVRQLQEISSAIGQRIQTWDAQTSEKFTGTLSLALHGVTGNAEFKSKMLNLDTVQLAHSNSTQACEALGNMLTENMRPAYVSLGHMKEQLDNMSRATCGTTSRLPLNARKLVSDGTHHLLNMAYVEHLALKEASAVIVTEVAPLVLDRLRCAFNAGSARASVGLAVLVTAFVVAVASA